MNDLEIMINNLDVAQLEFIENVVEKLATVKSEKWSGSINFKAQINEGGVADSYCDRSERLTRKRKRRTRSRGL